MTSTSALVGWARQADRTIQAGPLGGVLQDVREAAAVVHRARASAERTWVVSYPKSGVTWLRFMAANALGDELGVEDAATIEVDGLLERAGRPGVGWTHNGGALVLENGTRISPRGLFLAPRVLGFQQKRVLLLVRDPRDVTVSYYHQVTRRTTNPLEVGSLEDFYLHPSLGLRRTLHFHRRWERSKRLTGAFHVLRYESLRCGDATLLAAALGFVLETEVSIDRAASALASSTPSEMRARERAGAIEGMRAFGGGEDNDLKVRRAVVGGYRDELGDAAIARGDALMEEYSYPFGYCP